MTGLTSPDLKRDTAAGRYVAGLPAAPSPLDPIEYGNDAGLAERRLWGAVLALMVDDARRYWQGKKQDTDAEQAFDDLCRCGPMVRHCCRWLDTDPKWICNGFVSWCESMA